MRPHYSAGCVSRPPFGKAVADLNPAAAFCCGGNLSIHYKSEFFKCADELTERFAQEAVDVPEVLQGFIDCHGGRRPVQLALPLRGAA
jgi:hypothetical protein